MLNCKWVGNVRFQIVVFTLTLCLWGRLTYLPSLPAYSNILMSNVQVHEQMTTIIRNVLITL